jgi:hypothetical protein
MRCGECGKLEDMLYESDYGNVCLSCKRQIEIDNNRESETANPASQNYSDLLACLSDLVEIVKSYHEDAGTCDHEVGVCFCGEYSVLENADRLLKQYSAS